MLLLSISLGFFRTHSKDYAQEPKVAYLHPRYIHRPPHRRPTQEPHGHGSASREQGQYFHNLALLSITSMILSTTGLCQ